MGLDLTDAVAVLHGVCAIEEAEPLLAWLRAAAEPQVDLSRCDHVHAAVLQALLAARPVIAAAPPDPLLARLLQGPTP